MDESLYNQFQEALLRGEISGLPADQPLRLTGLGMILALRMENTDRSAHLLEEVAFHPFLPEFGPAAILQLQEMHTAGLKAATVSLYRLAVMDQNEACVEFLLDRKLPPVESGFAAVFRLLYSSRDEIQAFDPGFHILTNEYLSQPEDILATRIIAAAQRKGLDHWAFSAAAARLPVSIPAQQQLIENFGRFDETTRRRAVQLLAGSAPGQPEIQDTLCQLFLRYDDHSAAEVAVANSYLPQDAISHAVFLFLTNQWDACERFDFSGSLLTAGYETGSPEMRKRLLDFSRLSGRTDWVSRLSAASRLRWLNDLGDEDWQATIRTLKEQQRFPDLWLLAQSAPPLWSAEISVLLDQSGFQPSETEDQYAFANLAGLARKALAVPPVTPDFESLTLPSQNSTCIAISRDGKTLAAGTADATLYLCSLPLKPSGLVSVPLPVPQIRTILYSAGDQFLVAACGDNQIRVFRPDGKKVVKSIAGHTAMIRSLAISPDDRSLYSTGFDGDIRCYRFPEGVFANFVGRSQQEIFCAALSPQGDFLLTAGSDHLVSVWPLPSAGKPAHQLAGHTDSILALAVSPQGQLAVSAGRDRQIRVWNYVSGREGLTIKSPERLPTCAAIHPNLQEIIVGCYDGKVTIYSLSNGKDLVQMQSSESPINSLVITPDGKSLICSHNNGEIRLFDLSIHMLIRNPMGLMMPADLSTLEEEKKKIAHSPVSKWVTYILEMLRYRQRYDIIIDQKHPVLNIGEFDIQL